MTPDDINKRAREAVAACYCAGSMDYDGQKLYAAFEAFGQEMLEAGLSEGYAKRDRQDSLHYALGPQAKAPKVNKKLEALIERAEAAGFEFIPETEEK